MNAKERILKLFAEGVNAIGRTKLADGHYVGRKDADNYTVLHKPGENWVPLPDGQAPAEKTVIILTNVPTFRTKGRKLAQSGSASIAVNQGFVEWPLNTYFQFNIRNGRSELVMKEMVESNAAELISKLEAETVE